MWVLDVATFEHDSGKVLSSYSRGSNVNVAKVLLPPPPLLLLSATGYGASYGAKPAAGGYGASATGYGQQQAAGYGTQQAAAGYGAAAATQGAGYGQQAAYGAAAQVSHSPNPLSLTQYSPHITF